MPEQWEPTGAWTKRFRKALDQVYDNASMELLTGDYFGQQHVFSKLAPTDLGQPFEARLQMLIQQARMNGWLLDLVVAARERRPRSAELAAIADERGLSIAGRTDNPTGRPLEEIVREHAAFLDPALLRENLAVAEGRVCLMEIPGGGGTGFLVGPDLVLTNQHVIARLRDGRARAADVRCRFDVRDPGLRSRPSLDVQLAADWHVDSRGPSAVDVDPALGDAGAGETDTALVRLAEPVGEDPVGGPTADLQTEPRGWVPMSENPRALAAGHQVLLLQHPRGKPLRLTIGEVVSFNGAGTRVRYDANSRDGSSGSPVFDTDLQLVALHHARDPHEPPGWNQAVPIDVIRADWRARGIVVGGR